MSDDAGDADAHNPYASALDGLDIPDPVVAFFDFCREREGVRLRRERGDPAPWSDDPIFQRGRFLNVFREDDRGSKSIQRFLAPLANHLPSLIQGVFFARWCNRSVILDGLSATAMTDPGVLKSWLETHPNQPWCNVTAYPVDPVWWGGKQHSRLETAAVLFAEIRDELTTIIQSASGRVVQATQAINERFKMENDFPIFMAVMDLAWFRPDIINPASHVPTGIGAAPYLDRLQAHLKVESHHEVCDAMIALQVAHWPEAKRRFQPIDIEYLSCECRKYFSYRNGTKKFEGKNVFHPGEDAKLLFEIPVTPSERIQTQVHVIAGGPCSGKTTLSNALRARGFRVEEETSERLLQSGIQSGRSARSMRSDAVKWQQQVLRMDHLLFNELPVDEPLFADTSFVEDVVYSRRVGIEVGPNVCNWLRNKRYGCVFFLDPLDVHETTEVRMESQPLALHLSAAIQQEYKRFGYEMIAVPPVTTEERVRIILQHLTHAEKSD